MGQISFAFCLWYRRLWKCILHFLTSILTFDLWLMNQWIAGNILHILMSKPRLVQNLKGGYLSFLKGGWFSDLRVGTLQILKGGHFLKILEGGLLDFLSPALKMKYGFCHCSSWSKVMGLEGGWSTHYTLHFNAKRSNVQSWYRHIWKCNWPFAGSKLDLIWQIQLVLVVLIIVHILMTKSRIQRSHIAGSKSVFRILWSD